MRFLSMKRHGVAFDALSPEDYAKRKSQIFQYRALLDVQFEIGRGVLTLARGFGKSFHLETAAPDRFVKANAIFVDAAAVGFNRMRSRECGGPEQAAAETRAFFIGPVD